MGTAASFSNKSWIKPATKDIDKPKIARAQTAPATTESDSTTAPEMPLRVKTRRSTELFKHVESAKLPSHSLAIKTAEKFDPKAGANVVNHIVDAGFVFLEPGARVRRVGSFLDEAELAHQTAQQRHVRRSRRVSTEISEAMGPNPMHKSATTGTMFSLTLKAYRQWKIDSIDERLNVVEIYNAFRRSRAMCAWINIPELFLKAAKLLLLKGEALMATDVLSEGIKCISQKAKPDKEILFWLRQTLAMAFAQMKSTQHAFALLRDLLETGEGEDTHTKGLMGTVLWDLALSQIDLADPSVLNNAAHDDGLRPLPGSFSVSDTGHRDRLLVLPPEAIDLMRQSLESLKACWCRSEWTEVSAGAHAATAALVLGETEQAHRIAQHVLDSCESFSIKHLKRSFSSSNRESLVLRPTRASFRLSMNMVEEARLLSPVHETKRRRSLFEDEDEDINKLEKKDSISLHSAIALNDELAEALHQFEHLASVGESLIVLGRWQDAIKTYKKLKTTDRPILLSSIWRRLRLLQYHYRACTPHLDIKKSARAQPSVSTFQTLEKMFYDESFGVLSCLSSIPDDFPEIRKEITITPDEHARLVAEIDRLERRVNGAAYCMISSAIDIVVAEHMMTTRNWDVYLVLPVQKELVIEMFGAGDDRDYNPWYQRFQNLQRIANKIIVANDLGCASTIANYQYAAQQTVGLAEMKLATLYGDRDDIFSHYYSHYHNASSDQPAITRLFVHTTEVSSSGDGSERREHNPWVLKQWQGLDITFGTRKGPDGKPQAYNALHVKLQRKISRKPSAKETLKKINPLAVSTSEHNKIDEYSMCLHCPQIMVSMLFADVVGYSKLKNEQIVHFVNNYLTLVSKLIKYMAKSRAVEPLIKNTWGDAVYLAFNNTEDAGVFALLLRDLVTTNEWETMGLPEKFAVRISLHTGPVDPCFDPVLGRRSYTGVHTSRAARIEPITPPGEVYCSRAFASVGAYDSSFKCEYVGNVPLAKKYGVQPIHQVLWKSGQAKLHSDVLSFVKVSKKSTPIATKRMKAYTRSATGDTTFPSVKRKKTILINKTPRYNSSTDDFQGQLGTKGNMVDLIDTGAVDFYGEEQKTRRRSLPQKNADSSMSSSIFNLDLLSSSENADEDSK